MSKPVSNIVKSSMKVETVGGSIIEVQMPKPNVFLIYIKTNDNDECHIQMNYEEFHAIAVIMAWLEPSASKM